MTVPAGDAGHWVNVEAFRLAPPGKPPRTFRVEQARAYGDRLVLKLEGIDDGDRAAGLKGMDVTVSRAAAPSLDEGEHYRAELVGMVVRRADDGTTVGTVRDVQPTGAADLLVVVTDGDPEEILIPLTREIVPVVDERAREIRVSPPEGLLELNREDDRGTEPEA